MILEMEKSSLSWLLEKRDDTWEEEWGMILDRGEKKQFRESGDYYNVILRRVRNYP